MLVFLSSSTSPDSDGGDESDSDVFAYSTLLAVGADMKKIKHEGTSKKSEKIKESAVDPEEDEKNAIADYSS